MSATATAVTRACGRAAAAAAPEPELEPEPGPLEVGVGAALGVALSEEGDGEGVGLGEGQAEDEAEGGSAGHCAGTSNCANSHPPARQRAPTAGPEICPEAQRCAPAASVHQPQEVGSIPGSARPAVRHWVQLGRGGHLSAGSPAQ